MEEYGIMEYLELAVTRCGRWTGNREFIWSGLSLRRKLLLAELDRLGIASYYDTIEMSVLGHYLPISLSFTNCVNFIQNEFTMTKPRSKRIFKQQRYQSLPLGGYLWRRTVRNGVWRL